MPLVRWYRNRGQNACGVEARPNEFLGFPATVLCEGWFRSILHHCNHLGRCQLTGVEAIFVSAVDFIDEKSVPPLIRVEIMAERSAHKWLDDACIADK